MKNQGNGDPSDPALQKAMNLVAAAVHMAASPAQHRVSLQDLVQRDVPGVAPDGLAVVEWVAILAARAVVLGPLGRQLSGEGGKVDAELALRELCDPDRFAGDDPFGAFD